MSDESTETETAAAAADSDDATRVDVGVAQTPNAPTAYSEDAEPPALVQTMPKRRVVALAAGILAAACAVAGGLVAWDASRPTTPPPRSQAAAPPAINPLIPDNPHDKEFIDRMRYFNVPVPDWRYTVNQAQSLCAVMDQHNAPPGNQTIQKAKTTVQGLEPSWNEAQVHYFTLGMLDFYCPKFRIPTEAELARMAPDDRYMALVGDRLGLQNDNHRKSYIDNAHQVCSQLMDGATTDHVTDNINFSNIPPGMTQREAAAQFVDIAASVYCPQR